jgi:hypothetical protein
MDKPIEIDETTRERWIKQMQDDFPGADRLMCDLLISKWCEDPDYFDKLKAGEVKLDPPIERNTNYVYKGVTVDPVENSMTTIVEDNNLST